MKLIRFLKGELAMEAQDWVAKGLVSREQASDILERYGTKLPDGRERGVAYYILLSLASLLIGLAIIVIMGENWEQIPRALRMGFMLSLVVGFNVWGLQWFRQGKELAAQCIFLLGSLTYGASIFLIAQIYHIEAHYPNGVFWWAIGVLPFALLLKSKAHLLLTLVLASTWAVMEFSLGYFPVMGVLFLGSAFYFVFKLSPSTPLYLLSFALSVLFGEMAISHYLFPLRRDIDLGGIHVVYSVCVLMVSLYLPKCFEGERYAHHLRDYAMATRLWAMRLGVIFLFVFSFHAAWREFLISMSKHSGISQVFTSLMLIGVASSMWVRVQQKAEGLDELFKRDWLYFIALAGVAAVFSAGHIVSAFDYSTLFQIATNLLLFLTGIAILMDGLSHMQGMSFYTGLGVILGQAFCRYVDLIGDYVGGAAVFFIAGLIMIGAARFWKNYETKTLQVAA